MNAVKTALSIAVCLISAGCSSVGPGLANHPLDCAMGIKWADCLPGTAGYNNGGGQVTRSEEMRHQNETIAFEIKSVRDQCKAELETHDLDVIRSKVELVRENWESAPPFEIAVNDTFPNDVEKIAIAKWATLRDACIKRTESVRVIPENSTPLQVTFIQQLQSFGKKATGHIGDLIVSLYQQKLTYGEFAKKRYEISRDAADAQRQYKEAAQIADQQRQSQAAQLAQQQFQNNLAAWSAYMQSVNARQPQTVHVDGSVRVNTNCTTTILGGMSQTNCQ